MSSFKEIKKFYNIIQWPGVILARNYLKASVKFDYLKKNLFLL
jgi:hypothetical protein